MVLTVDCISTDNHYSNTSRQLTNADSRLELGIPIGTSKKLFFEKYRQSYSKSTDNAIRKVQTIPFEKHTQSYSNTPYYSEFSKHSDLLTLTHQSRECRD